jgi:hypothetical protein
MVSVMAFTSRAPRLQTSADRYYRFFDEGQQIGVDLVVLFENALMQKYDPGKPAIMASNHARQVSLRSRNGSMQRQCLPRARVRRTVRRARC